MRIIKEKVIGLLFLYLHGSRLSVHSDNHPSLKCLSNEASGRDGPQLLKQRDPPLVMSIDQSGHRPTKQGRQDMQTQLWAPSFWHIRRRLHRTLQ